LESQPFDPPSGVGGPDPLGPPEYEHVILVELDKDGRPWTTERNATRVVKRALKQAGALSRRGL
jgi:hypothetical protein